MIFKQFSCLRLPSSQNYRPRLPCPAPESWAGGDDLPGRWPLGLLESRIPDRGKSKWKRQGQEWCSCSWKVITQNGVVKDERSRTRNTLNYCEDFRVFWVRCKYWRIEQRRICGLLSTTLAAMMEKDQTCAAVKWGWGRDYCSNPRETRAPPSVSLCLSSFLP